MRDIANLPGEGPKAAVNNIGILCHCLAGIVRLKLSLFRAVLSFVYWPAQWILLDGDIDPMWIESLNTVMDDNKILTLASNERIAVTPEMKLIFEIAHLRTATPATVSDNSPGPSCLYPAGVPGWYPVHQPGRPGLERLRDQLDRDEGEQHGEGEPHLAVRPLHPHHAGRVAPSTELICTGL